MSEPRNASPSELTAEGWSARYRAGDTGWDKGRAAPPIQRLLSEGHLPRGATVAVIGAGRGHEALAAARAGYRAVAIDFAPEATEATAAAAAREGLQLQVEVLTEDVFALATKHAGAFDGILEHTCFCAIDPARKAEYARVIAAVLKPGGLFFGLFYAHTRPGGPPYATDEAEVRALFAPSFKLERLAPAPDSFPERAQNELEFVFVRR